MPIITYRCEIIGCTDHAQLRALNIKPANKKPWIAKITGLSSNFGFQREFLKPLTDYSEANSKGSRGIYLYFHLLEGVVYDVFEHLTWKKERRRYIVNVNGQLNELTKEEVVEYLATKKILDKWVKIISK